MRKRIRNASGTGNERMECDGHPGGHVNQKERTQTQRPCLLCSNCRCSRGADCRRRSLTLGRGVWGDKGQGDRQDRKKVCFRQ